ncbi:lactose-binding lectin l-2-like protein, partial [Aphelenchoides avenae]
LDGNGTQLSWQRARESCIAKGGNLVSIHSAVEQALAYALGLGAGVSGGSFGSSGIWIGLNRSSPAGTPWRWSDRSPNNFTHWAPVQPDNYGGQEFCAVLLTHSAQGHWNDYNCSGFEALWGAVGYGICKQP